MRSNELFHLMQRALPRALAGFHRTDNLEQLLASFQDLISVLFSDFVYQVLFADKFSDNRGKVLYCAYSSLRSGRLPKKPFTDRYKNSVALEAYLNNTLIEAEVAKGRTDNGTPSKYHYEIHCPIAIGEKRIGVLTIYLPSVIDTSKRIPLIKIISSYIYLVVDNFYLTLQDRLAAEIHQTMLSKGSPRDTINQIVALTARLIPAAGCSLFLYDPTGKQLYLEATTGLYKEKSNRFLYSLGEGLTGWVAKHMTALRVYNIDDDQEIKLIAQDLQWKSKFSEISDAEQIEFDEWGSYIGVPILSLQPNSSLLGVLRLSRHQSREIFTAGEEKILSEAGRLIAAYYHNLHSTQYREDLEFLHHLQEGIASTGVDPSALLSRIIERMSGITSTNDGYISVLDESRGIFSEYVTYGESLENRKRVKSNSKGHAARCVKLKKWICVNSLAERSFARDPDCEPVDANRPVCSELALPFIFKGKVVGVANLHSDRGDAFKYYDLLRLEALASACSVAIDYAFRLSTIQSRFQLITRSLEKVGKFYADRPRMFQAVLEELVVLANAKSAALVLIEEGQLVVAEIFNYSNLEVGRVIPKGKGIAGACIEKNDIIVWDLNSSSLQVSPIIVDPAITCEIGIPIEASERVLGCILIAFSDRTEPALDKEYYSMMRLLASQVGLAIAGSPRRGHTTNAQRGESSEVQSSVY